MPHPHRIIYPSYLIDDVTYAAFYISNLRTGANNQVALVSGKDARKMLVNSADPKRLFFVKAL